MNIKQSELRQWYYVLVSDSSFPGPENTHTICLTFLKHSWSSWYLRFYCWKEDSMEWLTLSPGNTYLVLIYLFFIYKVNRCEEGLASECDHKRYRVSFVLLLQGRVVVNRGSWWHQTWTTKQKHPWPKMVIWLLHANKQNSSKARRGEKNNLGISGCTAAGSKSEVQLLWCKGRTGRRIFTQRERNDCVLLRKEWTRDYNGRHVDQYWLERELKTTRRSPLTERTTSATWSPAGFRLKKKGDGDVTLSSFTKTQAGSAFWQN